MYRSFTTVFLLLAAFFCLADNAPLSKTEATTFNNEYLLGAGDVISIYVWDEPDLSFETALSDSGTIDYPFLGKVQATGLSASQLRDKIIQGLMPDYLLNPDVNIRVIQYRRFFIRGEINKPGGYQFTPGLTLRKAVALAGGFTARANESKIFIISDISGSETEKKASLETIIKPGDIINVKQRFF